MVQLIETNDKSLQAYVCEEVALFVNEFFDKNTASEKNFNEEFAAVRFLFFLFLFCCIFLLGRLVRWR